MSSSYHPKREAGLKEADYAMTLAEIGQELGVTRERVRQLENRALAKARKILRRRGYTLQDLLDGERNGYSQEKEWGDIDLFLQDSLPEGERHD